VAQAIAPGQRPLWLLETPLLLDSHSGRPFSQGWLACETGPERIETGWWDGQHIRRDYYVTHNPQGARLWVFRDRRTGAWYLHGMFG
jgi:protein ImuB